MLQQPTGLQSWINLKTTEQQPHLRLKLRGPALWALPHAPSSGHNTGSRRPGLDGPWKSKDKGLTVTILSS